MRNNITDTNNNIIHAKLTPEEIEQMEEYYQKYEELFQLSSSNKDWIAPVGGVSRDEKAYGGRLEQWLVEGNIVWGNLYDDPRKRFGRDGVCIHTSYVVDVHWDAENQTGVLETRNTLYDLGEAFRE